MEDADVITQINNATHIEKNRPTQSFIFSLKNRVGGLARALRVFEVIFFLFKKQSVNLTFFIHRYFEGKRSQCNSHRVEKVKAS
jgi:hypothetical protein